MMQTERKRVERAPKDLGFLGGVVGLPLLFVAAAFSIPYGFVVNVWHRRRENQFARRMTEADRAIRFDAFRDAMEAGRGTHIREWKTDLKGPVRWWWTPDDVVAISPHAYFDRFTLMSDSVLQPFVEWCFRQYTSPSDGKARFVVATADQKKSLREGLREARAIDVRTFSKQGW